MNHPGLDKRTRKLICNVIVDADHHAEKYFVFVGKFNTAIVSLVTHGFFSYQAFPLQLLGQLINLVCKQHFSRMRFVHAVISVLLLL